MVRRGFGRRARRTGRSSFSRRSGRRSRGGLGGGIGSTLMAGGLYGAGRGWIINAISGFSAQLQSPYAIPAILGVGGYLLARNSSGMVSDIGKAALTVEAANVGHMAIGSAAGTATTSSSSPSFGGWQ